MLISVNDRRQAVSIHLTTATARWELRTDWRITKGGAPDERSKGIQ